MMKLTVAFVSKGNTVTLYTKVAGEINHWIHLSEADVLLSDKYHLSRNAAGKIPKLIRSVGFR